jgi:hypothetical protein
MVTQTNADEFETLCNLNETIQVPAEWCVVLADIQGSTEAIKNGKLKEVNLVGAASIAAIRNHFDPKRVPYVFGGDGATFLCHQNDLQDCVKLISQVKVIAKSNFGMTLRLGSVSVGEIQKLGGEIFLGFLAWSETESMPFFRGNGIAMAEEMIKKSSKKDPKHDQNNLENFPDTVKGLSCRLSPFTATRGRILSILIEPTVSLKKEDDVFKDVFASLGNHQDLNVLSPIQKQTMRRSLSFKNMISESAMHQSKPGTLPLCFQFLVEFISEVITRIVFALNLKNDVIGEPSEYIDKLIVQSDWIKCDGMLRMVLDLKEQEEVSLRSKLDELHAAGKIYFGVHGSQTALLTCHIASAKGQRHTHFVDGGSGGFTMAAVQLKAQKREKFVSIEQIGSTAAGH